MGGESGATQLFDVSHGRLDQQSACLMVPTFPSDSKSASDPVVAGVFFRKDAYGADNLMIIFCNDVGTFGIIFIRVGGLKETLFSNKNFFADLQGSRQFSAASDRAADQLFFAPCS